MREQVDMVATSIFSIDAADRPGEMERLLKALKALPGMRGIEINYLLDTAKVRYDPTKLSLARIKAAMK
ncbi:MAG TPA: heavy-metal-associated domain-containing protein [Nitrososphaerales archaeon]|nr:heavy-metal-associated domain-containing protein [Nitrososphaerales archaeon]